MEFEILFSKQSKYLLSNFYRYTITHGVYNNIFIFKKLFTI